MLVFKQLFAILKHALPLGVCQMFWSLVTDYSQVCWIFFGYLFYTRKHRSPIKSPLAVKAGWKNDLSIAPNNNFIYLQTYILDMSIWQSRLQSLKFTVFSESFLETLLLVLTKFHFVLFHLGPKLFGFHEFRIYFKL